MAEREDTECTVRRFLVELHDIVSDYVEEKQSTHPGLYKADDLDSGIRISIMGRPSEPLCRFSPRDGYIAISTGEQELNIRPFLGADNICRFSIQSDNADSKTIYELEEFIQELLDSLFE